MGVSNDDDDDDDDNNDLDWTKATMMKTMEMIMRMTKILMGRTLTALQLWQVQCAVLGLEVGAGAKAAPKGEAAQTNRITCAHA